MERNNHVTLTRSKYRKGVGIGKYHCVDNALSAVKGELNSSDVAAVAATHTRASATSFGSDRVVLSEKQVIASEIADRAGYPGGHVCVES